jgi:release factor glutamine methyltransferase
MATIASVLADAARRLDEGGVENPRGEARVLLSHVLGLGPEKVIGHPELEIDGDGVSKFEAALSRRVLREPMSHVLGKREFWSLNFRVTPDTLDPRPDSETVVEAVFEHISDRGRRLRVLDLGTGTGCLLLAILSELPNATGVGVDISPAALDIAKENSKTLGFDNRAEFKLAQWDDGLDDAFDIVVSNPPYIPTTELSRLEPEVSRFEPRLALDGGTDGLLEYRALAPVIARRLHREGMAVVELGAGQSVPVSDIMNSDGLRIVDQRHDLGGVIRCLVLRHASALTNR